MGEILLDKFVCGEIVDVVIPSEQHDVKKIQRQRNILKNQNISRVLILSGGDNNIYSVAACGDAPRRTAVRIQAGDISTNAYAVPKLKIDGDVLRRVPNAYIENMAHVVQALEDIQLQRKEQREARREKKEQELNRRTAAIGFKQVPIKDTLVSAEVRYKKDTVACPKCRKLIPTGDRIVYVIGFGFPKLRVGLCETCQCYYSFSDKVFQNEGELNGWPVRWSNLRYRDGHGDKVVFKTIKRRDVTDTKPSTHKETQVAPAKSKENDQTPIAQIPVYDGLIKQLPVIGVNDRNCPICRRSPDGMNTVQYQIFGEKGTVQKRFAYSRGCSICKIIYFDAEQEKEVRRRSGNFRVYTIDSRKYKTAADLMRAAMEEPPETQLQQKNVRMPYAFDVKEIPNLSRESKEILVYAKKCHCSSCMSKYGVDTIRNRTAVIDTANGSSVHVNTMFCIGCGRYFMNYTSFEQYRKAHGGLLLEFRFTGELIAQHGSYLNFAPDSVLSRCGYSVKAGISSDYRHAVLRYVLDSGKATKQQIVELISGFIDLKYNIPSYEGACARWQEDIFFVNQYCLEKQKKVYGLKFKQGK